MIDTYLLGTTDRISPEAPVPVVNINKKEKRLGGAANVALNIKSLGAEAIVCSVIGKDSSSDELSDLFKKNNLRSNYLVKSPERKTTEKTRVFSRNQQMLRFDNETDKSLSIEEEKLLIKKIDKCLEEFSIHVVILQDYNKGVLTKNVITSTIEKCRNLKIPVAVDPKRNNFFEYANVSLFKPNLKEINSALTLNIQNDDTSGLKEAAKSLFDELNAEIVLITLSEKGLFIHDNKTHHVIPGIERNIADVSGAGDTVIAVASLCLAQKISTDTLASLANIAGGLVCEHAGVVSINKEQFSSEVEAYFSK